MEVSPKEMLTAVQKIKKCSNVLKLRSFQYRLLNRALVLNMHLYKWKMLDTNKCSFCGEEKEDYTHVFVNCSEIRPIWDNLREKLTRLNKGPVNLSTKAILTNSVAKKPSSIANAIVLMIKQYIYAKKCLGNTPNIGEINTKIHELQSMEKWIAQKKL